MGRKDKHKQGQSRNNPIFKVVGGTAGKTKNKPREVNIKLKNISLKSKTSQSTKEVIENLDAKLLDLQKKSIPLAGSSAPKSSSTYITPLTGTLSSSKIDLDSIVSNFETKMQSTTSKEPNKENN